MTYGRIRGIEGDVTRLVQGSIAFVPDDMEGGFRILDAVCEAGIRTLDSSHIHKRGGCDIELSPEEMPR